MTHSLRTRQRIARRSRQKGAALFVGLVLLLVMTVLGVSGMNTATLELAMAGNAQAQQQAFQAAETGIDVAISGGSFTTFEPTTLPAMTVGDAVADVEMTFRQSTGVPDAAFSLGVGTGSVQAFHFDVVATGTGPRGASSTHTQSFYVVGPGGP
jgi:type IV pilus assembly protein PilX